MIAFEELSAALDRWRIRNGLPVVSADLPIVPDAERAPAAPPFVMPTAAPATQPRTAPPTAATRPATDGDVYAMDDADVMEEDEYNNEGNDFSMSFGGAPAPANQSAPAKPPAPIYEESADYEAAEQSTHVADEVGEYQDPAYDTPQPLEAAPPLPEFEEDAEEDWSKMPNFPGNAPGPDTIDAGDEVVDDADDDRKR